MKTIIITGENGYISMALDRWLAQWPDRYIAHHISVRGEAWKNADFSDADAVFHGAGIAHQPHASAHMLDTVNRDLAIAVAQKAKAEGVGQFILMSTMAVYGREDVLGEPNAIDAGTPLRPDTAYGKSKYAAEVAIKAMEDGAFGLCVLRAPMVYGPNCPGNYASLRKLALFPGYAPVWDNQRSAIYIAHLCACIGLLIDSGSRGVFCPQDREYFHTVRVMDWIAQAHGRQLRTSPFLGKCLKPLAPILPSLRKAFGNLTYAPALSALPPVPPVAYSAYSLREAVQATEAAWRRPSTKRPKKV